MLYEGVRYKLSFDQIVSFVKNHIMCLVHKTGVKYLVVVDKTNSQLIIVSKIFEIVEKYDFESFFDNTSKEYPEIHLFGYFDQAVDFLKN